MILDIRSRFSLATGNWQLAAILLLLFIVLPAYAQDATPAVTADQVNTIASQMYCPVCENIPLDVCGTDACAQWRDEIRSQLEGGRTADQIIADFVARYGDRVVGTPQDPTLRALSLVTPWLIALVVIGGALWVFTRWRQNRPMAVGESLRPSPTTGFTEDDYRARIERDLQSRR